MAVATYPAQTLADAIWPLPDTRLAAQISRSVALAVAGTVVLWISAKIQIPFYPVPVTMQTLAVLVIGMAYGWRLGGATMLLYLAEGAAGLPVFANTPERGIGIAYMLGPTGGYLVGFFVAGTVCGWLAERGWDRNALTTAAAMFLGHVAVFVFGLAWLGTITGYGAPLLAAGLTPFLWGTLAKILLGTLVLPSVWQLLRRRVPGKQS